MSPAPAAVTGSPVTASRQVELAAASAGVPASAEAIGPVNGKVAFAREGENIKFSPTGWPGCAARGHEVWALG